MLISLWIRIYPVHNICTNQIVPVLWLPAVEQSTIFRSNPPQVIEKLSSFMNITRYRETTLLVSPFRHEALDLGLWEQISRFCFVGIGGARIRLCCSHLEVTDFYIESRRLVRSGWRVHKSPSTQGQTSQYFFNFKEGKGRFAIQSRELLWTCAL